MQMTATGPHLLSLPSRRMGQVLMVMEPRCGPQMATLPLLVMMLPCHQTAPTAPAQLSPAVLDLLWLARLHHLLHHRLLQ